MARDGQKKIKVGLAEARRLRKAFTPQHVQGRQRRRRFDVSSINCSPSLWHQSTNLQEWLSLRRCSRRFLAIHCGTGFTRPLFVSSYMESMSMKAIRPVLVAFMGVIVSPSGAGEYLKTATGDTNPIAIGECLSTCNSADCLRDCITNVEEPVRSRSGTQQSMEDCFGEALGNIASCADVVLLQNHDSKFDVDLAFWNCVTVASRICDQCSAGGPGFSLELEAELRKISLERLVDAAENDYRLFLAGKLTTHRLNVDVTSDGGDSAPLQGQREAEPTFDECLIDFVNNLVSCENQCGSNGACLNGCQRVAVKVYEKCAGVTPTA